MDTNPLDAPTLITGAREVTTKRKATLLHSLMHLFNLNSGEVVSKRDVDGNLWMAFQCGKCGLIEGRHRTSDLHCPVCGYYCIGNGGHGCIRKQDMQ